MPTPVRFYSSVAQATTLTSSIASSSTVIMVASTAGFPGSTPFVLALDYGQSNEELVDVTIVAGLSLTVTRAVDSTSATSHNAGAVVRHTSSGRDFADSRLHEVSTSGVHGVTGAGNDLVGTLSTQTLSNKTLNRATGSLQRVDIYNTGNWITDVVGDSTNPTVSRFTILDNEVNLRQMLTVINTGGVVSTKAAGEADSTYRFRVVDSDGTTDRFQVLAGGTMALFPTATAVAAPLAVKTDVTNSTAAVLLSNASGSQNKFILSNGGSIQVTPDAASAAITPLGVVSPAAISTDMFYIKDSTSATKMAVQSTGKTLMNAGGTIAQPGVLSGAVLQVGGSNVGYTGNLTQWVSPANTIVSTINQNGDFATIGIGQVLFARKTADTTRASTVTVTADPHMTLSVLANATYTVDGYIVFQAANTTGDMSIQMTVPASTSGTWGTYAASTSATAEPATMRPLAQDFSTIRTYGANISSADQMMILGGLVRTAGTAGTVAIAWAQATSDAGGLTFRTDSYIKLTRVA